MSEFIDFLYQHFPHRWLNSKAQGTNRLLNGLGKSLNYAAIWIDILKRNNSVQTANEIITELENEYGLVVNPSYDIHFRRQRITARMRIQDSPVTKNDLTAMIEALGFINCTIKNELNEYRMSVCFDLPEESSNKISEALELLNENVRAHIAFLIYALISSAAKNKNKGILHRLVFSAYVRNLGLTYITLNGSKKLNGMWFLGAKTKSISMNKLIVQGGIKNNENLSISLTVETLWYLDGLKLLDGSKKLNGGREQENV